MTVDLLTLGAAGVALATTALFLWLVASLVRPDSALRRAVVGYRARIERDLRHLLSGVSATLVIQGQLLALATSLSLAVGLGVDAFFYVAVLAVFGPPFHLRWRVRHRVTLVEEQLDGWLLMVANMLRATSSLTDAIAGTASLVPAPMGREVDLVLKEVRLGASLDQALRSMSARVGSRMVAATITALLVGRQTGGDLPRLLEETSASLRELRRLQAVLTARTSDARAQMVVLGSAPPVLYLGFGRMDPGFFDPLYDSVLGNLILAAAVGLWVLSLVMARRILKVGL